MTTFIAKAGLLATATIAASLHMQAANATYSSHNSCGGGTTTSTPCASTPYTGTPDLTWDFTSTLSKNSDGAFELGDTSSSLTLTVSGWTEYSGSITNTNNYLGNNGYGLIIDRPNDSHMIDNGGADEFVLLSFSEPVSLVNYSFGYTGSDYDSTLLYWDGAEPTAVSDLPLAGLNTNALTSNSWAAVGHYANTYAYDSNGSTSGGDDVIGAGTQSSSIYSSHWIIGAYMSDITAAVYCDTVDGGNDFFKLSSVDINRRPSDGGGEVPSPAPLALIAAGLFLLRKRMH